MAANAAIRKMRFHFHFARRQQLTINVSCDLIDRTIRLELERILVHVSLKKLNGQRIVPHFAVIRFDTANDREYHGQ